MGIDVSGVRKLGRGARTWALCAFPLVLISYRKSLKMEIASEDAREGQF